MCVCRGLLISRQGSEVWSRIKKLPNYSTRHLSAVNTRSGARLKMFAYVFSLFIHFKWLLKVSAARMTWGFHFCYSETQCPVWPPPKIARGTAVSCFLSSWLSEKGFVLQPPATMPANHFLSQKTNKKNPSEDSCSSLNSCCTLSYTKEPSDSNCDFLYPLKKTLLWIINANVTEPSPEFALAFVF